MPKMKQIYKVLISTFVLAAAQAARFPPRIENHPQNFATLGDLFASSLKFQISCTSGGKKDDFLNSL